MTLNRKVLFYGLAVAAVVFSLISNSGLVQMQRVPIIVVLLLSMLTGFVVVAFAHVARKGLLDYLDLGQIARKAQEHPVGAGLVFLGVMYLYGELLSLFAGALK